jgi:hypothetical protein
MNNQEFAPFYVGQEVECVDASGNVFLTKGKSYIVFGLRRGCCEWEIDISGSSNMSLARCGKCNKQDYILDGFYLSSRFRAITPAMQAVTFDKITEQHPVSVN